MPLLKTTTIVVAAAGHSAVRSSPSDLEAGRPGAPGVAVDSVAAPDGAVALAALAAVLSAGEEHLGVFDAQMHGYNPQTPLVGGLVASLRMGVLTK